MSGVVMKVNFKFNKKTLFAILIFILVWALIFAFYFYKENQEKYENAEKYKEFVEVTEPVTEDEEPKYFVDFEALQSGNPDIYAWLDIPDTTISYPMLRSEEEDFYLVHNADKQKSKYGAIYTQSYNTATFDDFNTIIYGHNTRNGSMFGSLRKFREKEFYDSHRTINIYTPTQKLTYKVFAVYNNDDTHILFSNDFSDMAVRRKYIADIQSGKKGANVDREIKITEHDKIITLSTCTTPRTKRLLVQAVLIDIENY